MRSMSRTTIAMLLFAVLMLGLADGHAAASFTVSPTPKVVQLGESFTVGVWLNNADLMHGSSVTVRFDSTILDYEGTTWGSFYPTGGFIGYSWPTATESTDTVVVDQALKGTAILTGSGEIFVLRFRALKTGSSPLVLQPVYLRDIHNDDIPSTAINGSVIVRPVAANLMAILQGPYSAGFMSTALRTAGVLPLSQPYTIAPWNYAGTELVGAIPANVVDWVLIELRTTSAAASKVATRAAFIRRDGIVVDLDGTSPVAFATVTAGNYFVVLRHRNHLAVMSANAVALSPAGILYDFTTGLGQYYGNEAASLGVGVYGIWCGDADATGDVAAGDRTATWNGRNQTGYKQADVDLTGDVAAPDRTLTWNNRNKATKVP